MHKPGESVTTIDAGTAQEWLHVLVAFAPYAGALLAVGAVIGFIYRRRPHMQGPASIIAGVLLYALMLWRYAGPDEWSWQHPITSAMYQIAPAGVFFVGPALLGAAIVRWFFSRYAKTSNQSLQPTAGRSDV